MINIASTRLHTTTGTFEDTSPALNSKDFVLLSESGWTENEDLYSSHSFRTVGKESASNIIGSCPIPTNGHVLPPICTMQDRHMPPSAPFRRTTVKPLLPGRLKGLKYLTLETFIKKLQ